MPAAEKEGNRPVRYDWLDEELLRLPGVTKDLKPEWNWTRYMVGGKLFCAVCHDDAGRDVYITMKLEPLRGEFLRGQFPGDVIPGYYMNKLHWNSVRPEGSLPEELLREMVMESYRLVSASLPKRVRTELGL